MGADGVSWHDFEKQLDFHADKICKRIHEGTYQFYPFREVEVEKEPSRIDKPAKYRTLSIATLRDTLVQNVLYRRVLYEPIEKIFSQLDYPHVVSFAYRKGKSAQQVANVISHCLTNDYNYAFDADIKAYFDTIPHEILLNRFAKTIGNTESRTYHLVRRFVKTDRIPYDSYKDYKDRKIFQKRNFKRVKRSAGVPQGGVLSGMLANLYLHDFDQWIIANLVSINDMRYIRYADDFIILSKTKASLKEIGEQVEVMLKEIGLDINKGKTFPVVEIREKGLNFVGFQFTLTDIRVRDKNIERYKDRVHDILQLQPKTKNHIGLNPPLRCLRWLSRRIVYKIQGLSGIEICSTCHHERIATPRSWIAFFKVITDEAQLHDLDCWTREVVADHIYKKYRVRLKRKHFKRAHLRNLVDEYYRVRKLRLKPCRCDLQQQDVWKYTSDLYVGRYFYTPVLKKPFRVDKVTKKSIELSIKRNRYFIKHDTLCSILNEVRTTGAVRRAELEKRGVRNSGQLIALLSALPGFSSRVNPMRLIDENKSYV
jgi:retron-type reverse transcriptase